MLITDSNGVIAKLLMEKSLIVEGFHFNAKITKIHFSFAKVYILYTVYVYLYVYDIQKKLDTATENGLGLFRSKDALMVLLKTKFCLKIGGFLFPNSAN